MEPAAAHDRNEELLLHAQEVNVSSEWLPAARVRITRRIVTEVQMLEVKVRREELVITEEILDAREAEPLPADRAPVTPGPLVFILSAEVPSVSLNVMPVERVTVTPTLVTADRTIDIALRSEELTLQQTGLPPDHE